MSFRSAALLLGTFSLAGNTVGADGAIDACNVEIEGATVLMSAEEVAAEWSSRGYVNTPPAIRSRGRSTQDPSKTVSYKTADNLPNDRFIAGLGWVDSTQPQLYGGQAYYTISTTYHPPANEPDLAAYKQFLRNEITSWCQWAAPVVKDQEGGGPKLARLLCGQVLAGEFMTAANDIPIYHSYAAAVQTWNGCNWTIGSDNQGRLSVSVTGPLQLAE